jgi:hypothetical protein
MKAAPQPSNTSPFRLSNSIYSQPKEITDAKKFMELAKRADAKSVKIKKPTKKGGVTKFKIRCSRVSSFSLVCLRRRHSI